MNILLQLTTIWIQKSNLYAKCRIWSNQYKIFDYFLVFNPISISLPSKIKKKTWITLYRAREKQLPTLKHNPKCSKFFETWKNLFIPRLCSISKLYMTSKLSNTFVAIHISIMTKNELKQYFGSNITSSFKTIIIKTTFKSQIFCIKSTFCNNISRV